MKEKRKKELVKNIADSNLPQSDKEELIGLLNQEGVTMEDFINRTLGILKIGKQLMKLLDVDLGD